MEEPNQHARSFGMLVLHKAWFSAWQFFADTRHDIALGLVGAVLTAYQRVTIRGTSLKFYDLGMDAVSVLAPFAIVWAALFVWHFWLAQAALTYEAIKNRQLARPVHSAQFPPVIKGASVNWTPWRLKQRYVVQEFASILAHEDPNLTTLSTEGQAF